MLQDGVHLVQNKYQTRQQLPSNSVQNCKSLAEHRAGCQICSGSSVLSFVGNESISETLSVPTLSFSDASKTENYKLKTHHTSEKTTQHENQDRPEKSSTRTTVLHPFCSSFEACDSETPSQTKESAHSISLISGVGNTSKYKLSTSREQRMLMKSKEKGPIGSFEDPLRNAEYDLIKLNDSTSKCEYQINNGVHRRLSSSFRGNGLNIPKQIHFDCNPRLSLAITKSKQKLILNTPSVSVAQSTFTVISRPPSCMTFNYEESLCKVPFQRCNLQKWKRNEPIAAESEDDESTPKPSGIESDSESGYSCSNNAAIESREAVHEARKWNWLEKGKLRMNLEDLSTVPSSEIDTLFSCGKCEKTFGNRYLLNRHIVGHQGLKPFKCSTCNKCFKESSNLLIHVSTVHLGRKDHICWTCGKEFGHKSHLRRHDRTVHQRGKDYICTTCGKGFGQKGTLTIHLRIHDGIKPFTCSKCQKSFTQKNHLTVHLRIHGNERPFACSVCDKRFTQKDHLRKHGNVHKEKLNADSDLLQ